MTTQGALPPLDATKQIDAERACLLFGNVRIEMLDKANEKLSKIRDKDKVVYKYIDFKDGVTSVSIKVKKGKSQAKIKLLTDKPWHKEIAEINIQPTKNEDWEVLTFDVQSVSGIHALWLQFSSENQDLFEIDWIKFSK